MFSPLKLISPPTILPGGLATSLMTESAVTLLPQPLSPTTPNVSPALMVNETSSTALTTPLRVKKCVFRFLTSSKLAVIVISPLTSLLIVDQMRRAGRHQGTRMQGQSGPGSTMVQAPPIGEGYL